MSLERLLAETLHQADTYEPSPDLFARVERSIAEDEAHRRRSRNTAFAVVAGVVLVASFLLVTGSKTALGRLTAPAWALEVVLVTIQVAVMLTIGPSIRRFGKIYVSDAFRLNPETGTRFLDLFDVAFYLLFTGRILMGVELANPGRSRVLAASADEYVDQLASFLLLMGVSHALTLLALPVIGLVFGSSVRRARRLEAGPMAPPVAAGAARVERMIRIFTWGLAVLVLVGGLIAVGLVVGLGLARD